MIDKQRETALQHELESLRTQAEEEVRLRRLASLEVRVARETRMLALERQLCSLRGDEHANALSLDVSVGSRWMAVLSFQRDARVICDLLEPNDREKSVLFTFSRTIDARMGGLNDEVFDEHSLAGKGLGVCGYYVVENSAWKSTTQEAMMCHPNYCAEFWTEIRHYLFRDKDGEFSCLAAGLRTEVLSVDFASVEQRLLSVRI